MKLIMKAIELIGFTMLFFLVVLPFGQLLRIVADPHCLRIRKKSASYFNMAPPDAVPSHIASDKNLNQPTLNT